MTFARSGRSVAADAATSLMDAGEGAGVQMPFGCRMGICQSCVVGLVEGHVRDLRTGAGTRTGYSGADLYLVRVGRLYDRHLKATHR